MEFRTRFGFSLEPAIGFLLASRGEGDGCSWGFRERSHGIAVALCFRWEWRKWDGPRTTAGLEGLYEEFAILVGLEEWVIYKIRLYCKMGMVCISSAGVIREMGRFFAFALEGNIKCQDHVAFILQCARDSEG